MFFLLFKYVPIPIGKWSTTHLVTELILKHYSMVTEVKVKLAGQTYLSINSKGKILLTLFLLKGLYIGCIRGDLGKI